MASRLETFPKPKVNHILESHFLYFENIDLEVIHQKRQYQDGQRLRICHSRGHLVRPRPFQKLFLSAT